MSRPKDVEASTPPRPVGHLSVVVCPFEGCVSGEDGGPWRSEPFPENEWPLRSKAVNAWTFHKTSVHTPPFLVERVS